MRIAALAIGAILALPIPLQAGSGDCGERRTLENSAASAAAVFVGRVQEVSATSDRVTFDVSWQWKGKLMPAIVEVQVSSADELTQNGASSRFAKGNNYLVFTLNAFDPFVVDACSGSTLYGDGSVIPPSLWEPLGTNQPRTPAAVPPIPAKPSPPTFSAMGAAALVGVTLLILGRVLWHWRRKRKAAGPMPYKMGRSDKTWLAEQESLETTKPSFGDRALQKQRQIWRKKHRKVAADAARDAAKEHASADS